MKNDFDFNVLFYESLYYISKEDVLSLEGSRQLGEIKNKFRGNIIEESPEYKAFHKLYWDNVCETLEKISQNEVESCEDSINIKFVKFRVYKYFETMIEGKYPNLFIEFTYDNEFLPKRKELTISARLKTEEEILETEELELEEAGEFGFMDIIDELIESKKPLITHNGFLDIMHLYNKFIGDLPETQSDFKKKFYEHFPQIYDTKFMLNNSNYLFSETNKFTALYDSFIEASELESPEIEVSQGFDYKLGDPEDEDSVSAHEAGFDALMTGVIFLRNMEKLGKKKK